MQPMIWGALLASTLITTMAVPHDAPAELPRAACPCHEPALCQPVRTRHEKEVFGFIPSASFQYELYNWSLLTTVARMGTLSPGAVDSKLICAAHAAGARVVMQAGSVAEGMRNASTRGAWVKQQIKIMQDAFMDGINFDYEVPMRPGSPESRQYSRLVQQMAETLHDLDAHYQVSVDVPWSPFDVDGRNYDWLRIANAADLLFVMSYDIQSQIWGRCVASANAPPALVRRGLQQWLDMGAPAAKLVLGVPWYGYQYECQPDAAGRAPPSDVDVCLLAPSTFEGAPCSDAVGYQHDFKMLAEQLRAGVNATPVVWDPVQRAHRFNFVVDRPMSVPMNETNGRRHSARAGAGQPGRQEGVARGQDGAQAFRASGKDMDALPSVRAAGADGMGWTIGHPAVGTSQGVSSNVRETAGGTLDREEDLRPSTGAPAAVDGSASGGALRTDRVVHQVWFDPPESLAEKYALARSLSLRGVGFWHLDCLAYSSDDPAEASETAAMWDAVASFTS